MRGCDALVLVACGCSFEPAAVNGSGDGGPEPSNDAAAAGPRHVAPEGAFFGTSAYTLAGPVDTTNLTIGGEPVAGGAAFDVWPQDPSGAELAVLHAGAITITGEVRVSGSRPFVILAGEDVAIEGLLDAGAHADLPGPGGAGPEAGPGAGGSGVVTGLYRDGGGGGGGFGEAGGGGGDATCPPYLLCDPAQGGEAGPSYGTTRLDVLEGGSGGGRAPRDGCAAGRPGAGGGAIQITSLVAITIAPGAGVHVGGGGGGGGESGNSCEWAAGAGGGSGGAIALQAPIVMNAGILAANGGAGGGSAGGTNSSGDPGARGQDGLFGTDVAIGGAAGSTTYGAPGGDGSALGAFAAPGGENDDVDGNGGGGGGAGGRILFYLAAGATPMVGTCSPTSMVVPE